MRIDTALDSHRSRLTGRWTAALALTVVAAGLTVATAPPSSAAGSDCTVSHLTTAATGASVVTYGVIDYQGYISTDPTNGTLCRLFVPASATEISFMMVGGGGSAFESFDGAAGGGGAGGVGVHNVTSFPLAAIPPNGGVDSFRFDLGVGDRDSRTTLTYTPDGGNLVTIAAGAGGTGGQGNNNSSSNAAQSGTPGEAGDFPGSGGGGGLDLNKGESGGSAGGAGAHPGGDAFALGYTNDATASAGGGGGAGGAGSNGTDGLTTGGAGGTGVSVSSVLPLPAAFVTAANLPATIAAGGDGYARGATSTPSTPSYGSGGDGLASGFSPGGSGVVIVKYVNTLSFNTTNHANGLEPSSMTTNNPQTFKVHLSGTDFNSQDPNSPSVTDIEWVDGQGQNYSCTAVSTTKIGTDEYGQCSLNGLPTLPLGPYNIKVTMSDGRVVETTGAPFQMNAGVTISNVSPAQLPNEGTQTLTITGSNLPPSNHPTLEVRLIQFPVGGGGGGLPGMGPPGVVSAGSVSPSSAYSDQGANEACVVDTSYAGQGIQCSLPAGNFYLRTASVILSESQGNVAQSSVTFIPTITGVTPSSGSAAGGESVTISGTGLLNATSVDIGGVAATIDANASNTRKDLFITTDISATDGAKDVSVVVPAPTGQDLNATMTATSVNGFTYNYATALTPMFDSPVATADGFTVNVTNYDPDFTWGTPSVTSGLVAAGTPNGANLPLTVTGLATGASATVTITNSRTGYNSGTGSVQASAQQATPSQPDPPSITQVTAGNGQATVTVAQAGTGGTPTSITVTSSGGQTCQVSGSSGSCTVTGLSNGTSYTFTATAMNNIGLSPSSAASSAVTPSTIPGNVATPTAVRGDQQALLTWTAPTDGGSAITGYKIELSSDSGANWTDDTTDTGSSATSYTVNNLTNGTTYIFRVTAINANGSSAAPSSDSKAVIPAALPAAPSGLSAPHGNGQVALSWTPGASSATLTGHLIEMSTNGGGAWTTAIADTGSALGSATVTGLTNGTSYLFRVAGISTAGTGLPVTLGNAVTPSTTSGAITGLTAQIGDQQVALSWTAPTVTGGAAIIGYRIEKFDAASGWTTVTPDTASTATTYTVTGLTNGTAHDFRVTPINVNGASVVTPPPLANPVTPVAAPGVPAQPSAVAGPGSATITVTAGTGGTPASFTVTALDPNNQTAGACTVTGASGSCTITGLTAGTAYTFTATATNANATSSASIPSVAVTPTAPTTPTNPPALMPPAAPGAVTVAAGIGSIIVSWTAPPSLGSLPISMYRASAAPGGRSCLVLASSLSCEITGLANGVSYVVRVEALTSAGWSPAAVSTPVIPGSVTPAPAPVPLLQVLIPGESLLLVNGVPDSSVRVDPNSGENGVQIIGDGWSMNLDGLGPDGGTLALGPNGVLRLLYEREVATSGTGFLPNSNVDLYVDPPIAVTDAGVSRASSDTFLVGTVRTDAQGRFSGTATLPADIAPGEHVLQAVGYSSAAAVRAMSLGVIVDPWIELEEGTRKAQGRHDRIRTGGESGGFEAGTRLTPWIRYSDQDEFQQGRATIRVQTDGSFTWTRKIRANRGLTAYVSYTATESNRVFWRKVR